MTTFKVGDRVKFKNSVKKPRYSARPTEKGMTVSAIFLDDEDKHIRCLYDEKLHSFEGISFTQVIHPGDLEYEYVELPYDPEQQGDRDDDI